MKDLGATESDRKDRVGELRYIAGQLDVVEPAGGSLSFAALPGMTALVGARWLPWNSL